MRACSDWTAAALGWFASNRETLFLADLPRLPTLEAADFHVHSFLVALQSDHDLISGWLRLPWLAVVILEHEIGVEGCHLFSCERNEAVRILEPDPLGAHHVSGRIVELEREGFELVL